MTVAVDSLAPDTRDPKGLRFDVDFLVTPAQFFAEPHALRIQPERRLMLAVLTEAIETVQRYALVAWPPAQRQAATAQAWIDSAERGWPFAFVPICDALGLDAGYIRRGLEAWLAARRAAALPGLRARRRIVHQLGRRERIGGGAA